MSTTDDIADQPFRLTLVDAASPPPAERRHPITKPGAPEARAATLAKVQASDGRNRC